MPYNSIRGARLSPCGSVPEKGVESRGMFTEKFNSALPIKRLNVCTFCGHNQPNSKAFMNEIYLSAGRVIMYLNDCDNFSNNCRRPIV